MRLRGDGAREGWPESSPGGALLCGCESSMSIGEGSNLMSPVFSAFENEPCLWADDPVAEEDIDKSSSCSHIDERSLVEGASESWAEIWEDGTA